MLGVAESSIYRYIQSGRLEAYQAGHNIMIGLESLKQFKPNITGRPRKKNAPWHISPDTSAFVVMYIRAEVYGGKEEALKEVLREFRQDERHVFPGTVVRYVSINENSPASVTIQLVWKQSDMPERSTLEQELSAFRGDLADMIAWKKAQYSEEMVLLHT